MLRRLRLKFICVIMTIVTLMLCVILGLIFHFTKVELETEHIQMMQTVAMSPVITNRPDILQDQGRLPFFVLEVDNQGRLKEAFGNFFDLSDPDLLHDLVQASLSSDASVGTLKEYKLRFFRIDKPGGMALFFADISSEINTLQNLIRTCLLIGTLSFFVFLMMSILFAHWAVRPVEKAWKQQQQFVSDASHELKTPLTVILANADMLQSSEYDEQSRSQFISNINIMSRQMRKLVEGLLELARADNGAASAVFSQIDLSALLSNALLLFEPLCYERGLAVDSRIEPDLVLSGSESHLQQVIDILLDNAQKYAAHDSAVEISLCRKGRSHCLLSVATMGEPISKDDLKNIFKRFYRVDKARSERSSYGLGLSIAESIVQMHKGKIWAESEGGVNTFLVQLPILPND